MSLKNCVEKWVKTKGEQEYVLSFTKPYDGKNLSQPTIEALAIRDYARTLVEQLNRVKRLAGDEMSPLPEDINIQKASRSTNEDNLPNEDTLKAIVDAATGEESIGLEIATANYQDTVEKLNGLLENLLPDFIKSYGEDMYEEFQKTLEMIVVRIPSTGKKTTTPVKIVGFAYGAGNTFYVNTDILYLQGADQDIDKGNLLSYEPVKGKIDFAEDIENETSLTKLRNTIVQQMLAAGKDKNLFEAFNRPTIDTDLREIAEERVHPYTPFMHSANPLSTQMSYVLGQAGKSNVGIHANGLKAYSAIFHSLSNTRNQTLENYKPKYEGFGGVHVFGEVDAINFYDQLIQASVDNAKDPLLGQIGIDDANANLVNALALFSHQPKKVADFLNEKPVKEVFDKYRKSKRLGSIPENLKDIAQTVAGSYPDSGAMQDLIYYLDVAEELEVFGKFLGINKEVPNSAYESYVHQRTMNKMLNDRWRRANPEFTSDIYQWVIDKVEGNQDAAYENEYESLVKSGAATLNIYQILEDNEHFMNYAYLSAKVEEVVNQNSPAKVLADRMANLIEEDKNVSEIVYTDMLNYTYGLMIDKYLSSGIDSTVKFKGASYDLSNPDERKPFISQFPKSFQELRARNKKTFLDAVTTESMTLPGENNNITLLKPFKRYSAMSEEDKITVAALARNMDKDVYPLSKTDTPLSTLMFYYWLIRDKGMNKPMSFTFMMDPTSPEFSSFNDFLKKISTPESVIGKNEISNDQYEALLNNYLVATMTQRIVPKDMKPGWEAMDPVSRFSIPHKYNIEVNEALADFNPAVVDMVTIPQTINSLRNRIVNEKGEDGHPIIKEVILRNSNIGKSNTVKMLKSLGFERGGQTKVGMTDAVRFQYSPKPSSSINYTFTSTEEDVNFNYPSPNKKNVKRQIAPSTIREYESQRVGRKVLTGLVELINSNTNGKMYLLSTKEILEKYGKDYASLNGFQYDDVRIINSDNATLDTPMHETGHLWIGALQNDNLDLYNEILEMSLSHPIVEEVRRRYPELNEQQLGEEVFSTIFGAMTQNKAKSALNKSFFQRAKDLIKRFKSWLNGKVRDLLGLPSLEINDSLSDIINKVGDDMLYSPLFKFNPKDYKILRKFGIGAAKLNSELDEIRNRLTKEGLIEKVC